jgi:hypothetical protein
MLWKCAFWFFWLHLQFWEVYTKTLPQQFPFLLQAFEQCFFVKTQRTPTQTDTTILSVYSLSLVTIITGHLILTKNSKSERFVHFFARERQSDSPLKTSTLRCQMQAQRPTFYIDCRKTFFFYNRQKNVTFMHRYQVAKYVILTF